MWMLMNGEAAKGNADPGTGDQSWRTQETDLHIPLGLLAGINPAMQVICSCGCRLGEVEHLESSGIKLARTADGRQHFIPASWVVQVDDHVYLDRNIFDVKDDW